MNENAADVSSLSRRRFLRVGLLAPLPIILGGCGGAAPATTQVSSTTPSASPGSSAAAQLQRAAAAPTVTLVVCSGVPTPSQTEGPYFKAGSPERASLAESGMAGTKLTLTGVVLTRSCQPVARAKLDFWQADTNGNYDNSDFRLRGNQLADESGRFRLETIIPGEYPGRTEHIHVKVQAPNRQPLTTQVYFPNVAANQRDGIFDAALVMEVHDAAAGKAATFNFVLDLA